VTPRKVQEIVVPPYSGRVVEVARRQVLRVVDREGSQIADLVAVRRDDHNEVLDTTRTRNILGRCVLKSGDRLFTNYRRPAFVIVRDDVGRHDFSFAACDKRRYELDFGVAEHPNCLDNLTQALGPYGFEWWRVPNPVNIFQNTPLLPDGTFGRDPALSKAGDCLELLALMDLVVAVSACSQDLTEVNGWNPTSIGLEVVEVDSL
jgi:uncharacterized protein YcgI (DUF1989 family)